jgi:hypothetical protein
VLAWVKITPTTNANCWKKCSGKDDVKADKKKLIPFSKQDKKTVCDEFTTNLQADNLATWLEVDEKTPVM